MQEDNPYAAPSSNLGGQDSYGDDAEGVTRGVVAELSGTKGWTRFVGVSAIIIAIVVLLGGLVLSNDMNSFANRLGLYRNYDAASGVLLGMIAVFTLLFLTYGILLNSFSSAVTRLLDQGSERALYEALRRQRNFWIFWGVLSMIITVFSLIGLLS